MAVEYFRLINLPDGISRTMSEIPTLAWWGIGIGLVFLVVWTVKK